MVSVCYMNISLGHAMWKKLKTFYLYCQKAREEWSLPLQPPQVPLVLILGIFFGLRMPKYDSHQYSTWKCYSVWQGQEAAPLGYTVHWDIINLVQKIYNIIWKKTWLKAKMQANASSTWNSVEKLSHVSKNTRILISKWNKSFQVSHQYLINVQSCKRRNHGQTIHPTEIFISNEFAANTFRDNIGHKKISL